MSNNPTGPWEYKGMIMHPDGRSSGNHPGIIDYKGSSYVFGFNYTLNFALTDVHRERRSVTLAKFSYNPGRHNFNAPLVEQRRCSSGWHSEPVCSGRGGNHGMGIRTDHRSLGNRCAEQHRMTSVACTSPISKTEISSRYAASTSASIRPRASLQVLQAAPMEGRSKCTWKASTGRRSAHCGFHPPGDGANGRR